MKITGQVKLQMKDGTTELLTLSIGEEEIKEALGREAQAFIIASCEVQEVIIEDAYL